jgi:hypothetical protein
MLSDFNVASRTNQAVTKELSLASQNAPVSEIQTATEIISQSEIQVRHP